MPLNKKSSRNDDNDLWQRAHQFAAMVRLSQGKAKGRAVRKFLESVLAALRKSPHVG